MEKDIWHTVPGLVLFLPIIILSDSWRHFSGLGQGLLALLVTWGVGYIWHQGYRVWFESWLGGDGFARKDRRALRILLAARDQASVCERQYTRKDYWQAFLAWEHTFYSADWPRFAQHNKEQWHYIFAYRATASAAFASAFMCLTWVWMDVARAEGSLLSAVLYAVSVLFANKAHQTYRSLNLQEEMAVRHKSGNIASGAPDFAKALVSSKWISLPEGDFWRKGPACPGSVHFAVGCLLVGFVGIIVGCIALHWICRPAVCGLCGLVTDYAWVMLVVLTVLQGIFLVCRRLPSAAERLL